MKDDEAFESFKLKHKDKQISKNKIDEVVKQIQMILVSAI